MRGLRACKSRFCRDYSAKRGIYKAATRQPGRFSARFPRFWRFSLEFRLIWWFWRISSSFGGNPGLSVENRHIRRKIGGKWGAFSAGILANVPFLW